MYINSHKKHLHEDLALTVVFLRIFNYLLCFHISVYILFVVIKIKIYILAIYICARARACVCVCVCVHDCEYMKGIPKINFLIVRKENKR